MVVTRNQTIARDVRLLRDWGQDRKYHHVVRGFNYRMDGLQGAILRVKLRHLEDWTEARRTHARDYGELLRATGFEPPLEASYARHVYHVYVIRTRDRAAVERTLHAHGIATGIHYPVPVHLQPAYADLGYQLGDFPESERAADQVLSLPMYPELSHTQIEAVTAAIQQEARV
jgi:dTDP-4-amino-4,6-dideoxygalactose transaminase